MRYGSAAMDQAPPLLLDKLSDDVLLEILSHVRNITQRVDDKSRGPPLLPGVAPTFSAIQSVSLTSRRLRRLALPIVFRKVSVSGDCARLSECFRIMKRRPAVLANIRSLSLGTLYSESKPPESWANTIVEVLPQMPKLYRLDVELSEDHRDAVAAALASNHIRLPSVRILLLESYCEFLVQHCPLAECIISGPRMQTRTKTKRKIPPVEHDPRMTERLAVQAAASAQNVKHLALHANWSIELVQYVYDRLPNLRTLAMDGTLLYGYSPPDFMHILGKYQTLQVLGLPETTWLNVGYCPPAWANAVRLPDGVQAQGTPEHKLVEINTSVAMSAFKSSKSLGTVWIGGHLKADVERDRQGYAVSLQWTFGNRVASAPWGM